MFIGCCDVWMAQTGRQYLLDAVMSAWPKQAANVYWMLCCLHGPNRSPIFMGCCDVCMAQTGRQCLLYAVMSAWPEQVANIYGML